MNCEGVAQTGCYSNEPKIRHVTLVFSAFNSGHIISFHLPDVKMLRFFGGFIVSRRYWYLISPSFKSTNF